MNVFLESPQEEFNLFKSRKCLSVCLICKKVLSADFTGGGRINQEIFLAKAAVVRLYMNSNFPTFGYPTFETALGVIKY